MFRSQDKVLYLLYGLFLYVCAAGQLTDAVIL